MEPLLALERILLQALPTFFLVWILYFYTTRVFLGPLEKTLRERYQITGGRREIAERNLKIAEQKTAEYEEALRTARAELYLQQAQERQLALERRTEIVRQARQRAEETVLRAKQELATEVSDAKQRLASESGALAQSILQAILEPAPGLTSPHAAQGPEGAR
ncbi:MAG: ATP synthase F0 subunit B [Acidobacteria bacterium]|nr:ATP synthase F0 subunit B [Acidobacteriota bacterium]